MRPHRPRSRASVNRHPLRRKTAAFLAAAAIAGGVVVASAPAVLASGADSTRAAPASGSAAFDWLMLHYGPARQGYVSNSTLSTANAGQLGVAWATNLYGAALDSPVVAYVGGKMLAYIGTERGDMLAIDMATGHVVWSVWLGAAIRSTPVVADGSIFVGAWDPPRIYKLNASTGAIQCSLAVQNQIEGSPLVVTPPGGVRTAYFGTLDGATSGPLLAVNASNCKTEWSFTNYVSKAGSWDPLSYAVDAKSRPLIVFGTSDTDSGVYAINAVTGARVWDYLVDNPKPSLYDVGSGVTLTPPKKNGFADGAAYVTSKYGILYALDLTTGQPYWTYQYGSALGVGGDDLSTAALDGQNLVFGDSKGVVDVNAIIGVPTNGKPKWADQDPAKARVESSPAIAGTAGNEIVAFGDLAGEFDVASLATGAVLYHYQTGGYITASPAISNGNILIASSDGFLYDFAVGGGNETTLPTTTITSPSDFQVVANPNGNLQISGLATDSSRVGAVDVAIQSGGATGPWWDGSTSSWSSGPVSNSATLTSPGAASSTWTFSLPIPSSGGTYSITANTMSGGGQADIKGAQIHVTVLASTTEPMVQASPVSVGPTGTFTISGSGFAPSESVGISLLGQTLATVTATATGALPATSAVVPADASFGPASLTATGATSGRTTTAAFVITNNWDQLGHDAAHVGFEPNDLALFDSLSPGGDIFLDRAWSYAAGSPLQTAPAIYDEVAYTGNNAGQLLATDVHNGALLWSWQTPSKAAIHGSPAVDPAAGLVFVGADDGTLDAISTSTGKLAWSVSVGGTVYAPIYASGEVYVTSTNGTVEAVNEATHQMSWSKTMPTSIAAAPALDPVAGTLVVTESNGDVVALNSGSGTSNWTYPSGGTVDSAAMIYGGLVYFGASHNVVAVSETTGTKVWQYATGGNIEDTPVLTTAATGKIKLLMVGSDDGILYALNGDNGVLQWETPFSQPITGVATVYSIVVVTTKSGVVGAGRTWTNNRLWVTKPSAAAGIVSAPTIVDGTLYFGASDGNLYAYTTFGRPPP